jgi:hypothetical protein
MNKSLYPVASGLVFLLVAIAHAVRAVRRVPIHFGSHMIPVWASWGVAAGALLLFFWALGSRKS